MQHDYKRTWTPQRWEQDQVRLQKNFERAVQQVERTRAMQARHEEQLARVKSTLSRCHNFQESAYQS